MAGIPLLLGFVAKEAGFDALHQAAVVGSAAVLATVVAGSVLTVAYTARLVSGTLGRDAGARNRAETLDFACGNRGPGGGVRRADRGAGRGRASCSGWCRRSPTASIGAAAQSLDGDSHGVHLAVWHGVNLALVLSAVALAAGAALVPRTPTRRHRPRPRRPDPLGHRRLRRRAARHQHRRHRVTAVVQNGSLPIYAGHRAADRRRGARDGAGRRHHVAGLAGLRRRQRASSWWWSPCSAPRSPPPSSAAASSAALFLGTTGYAMAGLFVVQGAPDLALTQVAIETLSTVLFVLVLRRLPDRFERTSNAGRRTVRIAIALAVAAMVFAFAIVSRAYRTESPVSSEMIEQAAARGPRPQRRQRDPRRHPRARHARRDHRARRRGDRRGGAWRAPAGAGRRRRQTLPRPTPGATR